MKPHNESQPDSALEREIEQILFGRIMNARLEGYTVETARQIMELIAVHRGSGVQSRDDVIEECAKVADTCKLRAEQTYGVAESVGADMAARSIRRLSSVVSSADGASK